MNSLVPYKTESIERKPMPTWKRISSVVPSVAFFIALLCLVTGDIPGHTLHDSLARAGLTWIADAGEVVDHFMSAISAFADSARLPQAVKPFVLAPRRLIVTIYLIAMAVAGVCMPLPAVVTTLRPKCSWHDIASW